MSFDYKEIYDEYNETIRKWAIGGLSCVPIRKDENGEYFFDVDDIAGHCFLLSGLFPLEMVVDAFSDFDFKDIDQEGIWEFDALLSYSPAQMGEYGRTEIRDYLEIVFIEAKFNCTFDEQERQEEEFKNTTFPF